MVQNIYYTEVINKFKMCLLLTSHLPSFSVIIHLHWEAEMSDKLAVCLSFGTLFVKSTTL